MPSLSGRQNDAAVAVAEYLAGSEASFAAGDESQSSRIGNEKHGFQQCQRSSSPNPRHGWEHHSSAYDLAVLCRHAVRVPHLLEMVSTPEYTMRPDTTRKPHLYTLNELLDRVLESGRRYGYPGLDGIKTGMTSEAGYCPGSHGRTRRHAPDLSSLRSAHQGSPHKGYCNLAGLRFPHLRTGDYRSGQENPWARQWSHGAKWKRSPSALWKILPSACPAAASES